MSCRKSMAAATRKFVWILILFIGQVCSSGDVDIAFVVLSQRPNLQDVAQEFRRDVDMQAKRLSNAKSSPQIHLLHEEWPTMIGAWTIFPILKKLASRHVKNKPWIFICHEGTRVRLEEMTNILKTFLPKQEYFIGNALHDTETTIIHHFASSDGPNKLLYPNSAAGFVLSFNLIERIADQWQSSDAKLPEFSIDPTYELANFIRGNTGLRMLNSPHFCVDDKPGCISYLKYQEIYLCNSPVPNGNIIFAVKTCSQFHNSRVPIVKRTWGLAATNIAFYSNESDPFIPTINLGIPNTENGHCAKTFSILVDALIKMEVGNILWLVVTDDDTLLSVHRLQKYLSCYDNSKLVAIGERYGYKTAYGTGYDYITGGGGMVFSKPLVKLLVNSGRCRCPTADTPDDMFLGMCLQSLKVPITHSSLFHQARPVDYNQDLLLHQEPISFHKHWMIDPVDVYLKWLSPSESEKHDEL